MVGIFSGIPTLTPWDVDIEKYGVTYLDPLILFQKWGERLPLPEKITPTIKRSGPPILILLLLSPRGFRFG